jgi:hypothetical protein
MLLDKQNMFSDQQNLAVAAGSVLSTNTIDLRAAATGGPHGPPPSDFGMGSTPHVMAQITEAFTSGGAGTLQVQVITADDAALTSNVTVHNETRVYTLAELTLGRQFPIGLQAGITKRYMGLRYIIGTAAMTAGKVSAGLTLGKQAPYAA